MKSQTPPPVDRVEASKKAVEARRARAEVKRRLASGAARPVDVLAAALRTDTPQHPAATMRVPQFLRAIPHIGETKSTRILERLEISPVKKLGGLGKQQRERLRQFLLEWEAASPVEPRVIVLAGPTAVGKGTVAKYIRDNYPDVHISVSATTRKPRPGEREGVDYYFVNDAEFDRLIADNELLEYATVHNAHRYGTPAEPLRERLAKSQPVLLEIDLQGARQVKERMPEARLVFLAPPSWDELVRRLIGRGTESADEQERRLQTAKVELASVNEFDAYVVNSSVSDAAHEVLHLMGLDEGNHK